VDTGGKDLGLDTSILVVNADRAQAQAGLYKEPANAHAEATTSQEATLHAKIEAAQEIQHVKEAMVRRVEKEVASLKKKLEVAE
jgi:hypothetical protein